MSDTTIRWWHLLLFFLLMGYSIFDRTFAGLNIKIGILPLYISELILLIGIFATLPIYITYIKRIPGYKILSLFFIFGLIMTFIFLKQYKVDALRDACIYYYALFIPLAMIATNSKERKKRFLNFLAWANLLGTIWTALIVFTDGKILPTSSMSTYIMSHFKGDFHVMMINFGIVFGLLVAPKLRCIPAKIAPYLVPIQITIIFFAGWRAGILGFIGIFAFLLILKRWKSITKISTYALVLFILAIFLSSAIDLGDYSFERINARILSTFSAESGMQYGDQWTKHWRLDLWKWMLERSFSKPLTAVFGHGFGENPVFIFGYFARDPNFPLRSPHSIFIVILYRMGVIGILLFLTFNIIIIKRVFDVLKKRAILDKHLAICGGAIVISGLLVGSVSVLLDAPHGSIWYWVGVGLVSSAYYKKKKNESRHNT